MNKLLLAGSLLLSTQHIEGLRLFKDLIKNKKALQVKKTGCSKVMPKSELANGESLMEMYSVPGAGSDLKSMKPYESAYKDGYSYVNCLHDGMRHHADKHEDPNAYAAQNIDVSIVWYKTLVAKEDMKAMTPDVCFSFCRSLENMNFFGLLNSKECYCMPYYKIAAGGEDTICDSACEGDPSKMCGGLAKTSVYEMHMCADTMNELGESITDMGFLEGKFEMEISNLGVAYESIQYAGSSAQMYGGQAGDKFMGGQGMALKKMSGKLSALSKDGLRAYIDIVDQLKELNAALNWDFGSASNVDKADALMLKARSTVNNYKPLAEEIHQKVMEYSGQLGTGHQERMDQYWPATRWIDNKQWKKDGNQTDIVCSAKEDNYLGSFIGDPKDCAYRCDQTVHPKKCIGFQHFGVLASSTTIPSGVPLKRNDQDGWDIISGFNPYDGAEGKFAMKNAKPSPLKAGTHMRSDNYVRSRVKAGYKMKLIMPEGSCYKFSLRMYSSAGAYELYTQKAWTNAQLPCGTVMWKDGAKRTTRKMTIKEANEFEFTVQSDSDEAYASLYSNIYGDHTKGEVKIDFEQAGPQEPLVGTCNLFSEVEAMTYYTCEGEDKKHAHAKSGSFSGCYMKFSENKAWELRDDKVNRNDRCLLTDKLDVPELKEFQFHTALAAMKK